MASSTATRRPWRAGSASYSTTSGGVPSTADPTPTNKAPPPHRTLSLAEMERRRVAGLCYYCEEKFVMGHRCKKLFVLEIDLVLDYENDLDIPVGSNPEISLAVVASIQPRSRQTMRIMVLINNRPLVALLDSGSRHNFTAESVVHQAALSLQSRTDLRVTVANRVMAGFQPSHNFKIAMSFWPKFRSVLFRHSNTTSGITTSHIRRINGSGCVFFIIKLHLLGSKGAAN